MQVIHDSFPLHAAESSQGPAALSKMQMYYDDNK
jgi:hypothetical protein